MKKSNVALLTIDIQYIHSHPDFSVSGKDLPPESREYTRERLFGTVLPSIRRLQNAFRANNALVVHIVLNHQAPDGSDLDPDIYARDSISGNPDRNSWSIRRRQDPMTAILMEVAPLPGEIVLEKVTHSSFASTNLNNVMINHKVDTIIHTGGATNCCVQATANDSKRLGYKTVCVPDACIAKWPKSQEEGLAMVDYDALLSVEDAIALL
ncbi:isochorismatase family cysteine hydrolase [Candidatus Hydrogenedentota bacterium]